MDHFEHIKIIKILKAHRIIRYCRYVDDVLILYNIQITNIKTTQNKACLTQQDARSKDRFLQDEIIPQEL